MSHVLVMHGGMLGMVAPAISIGRIPCMVLGSMGSFEVIKIVGSVQWKYDVWAKFVGLSMLVPFFALSNLSSIPRCVLI